MAGSEDDKKKIEVLDPLPPEMPGGSIEVMALIKHYTERPDLFLEVVEKHDPGFIKRMNENAEQGAKKFRDSRFRFGRLQAYTTLAVQVVAALVVLGLLFLALEKGLLTFWTIIGLAVFYAVAQGGRNGFVEIAKGVASFFTNKGKDAPKE